MIVTLNKMPTTIFCLFLVFSAFLCYAEDTIKWNRSISDLKNETLISAGNKFELGFFTPNGASHGKRYVGIWYYHTSPKTVIWVANRDKAVEVPNGTFGIVPNGTLMVCGASTENYWSIFVDNSSKSLTVKLLDSGNLVFSDNDQPASSLWESFQNPTDTFLPGMKMDGSLLLTSWKDDGDPGIGKFQFMQEEENSYLISKMKVIHRDLRVPESDWINEMPSAVSYFLSNFTESFKPGDFNPQLTFLRLVMNYTGRLEYMSYEIDHWNLIWWGPGNCSIENFCGIFGSCNNNNRVSCKCLPGFKPINSENWKSEKFSDGCTRNLMCGKDDSFLILKMMKVRDKDDNLALPNERECNEYCLGNCLCQACSYVAATSSCSIWYKNVSDLQEENKNSSFDLYVRVAKSDIEPTVRSCKPCGTNMIPYPLSTGPNCGDPMYSSFFCNSYNGQLYFNTSGGSYRVSIIDPNARKFVITFRYEGKNGTPSENLLPNKSTPFVPSETIYTVNPIIVTKDVEIIWDPPPEPNCKSPKDCEGWENSICKAASYGKKRCLCTIGFQWNGTTVGCTKGEASNQNQNMPLTLIIVTPLVIVLVLVCVIVCIYMWRRKMTKRKEASEKRNQALRKFDSERHLKDLLDSDAFKEDEQGIDIPFFDFESILEATNTFSDANKLGQGGYGPVYKGMFRGGQEIAVKRLSNVSGQGLQEFKNEVVLIAKLQHKNLVRLRGYCIKGEEKILLYEYMQNKSLDLFLFDQSQSKILDWQMRINIILGIARGLLYLHHDSRLKIIHRDLKTSNILLDNEMNPKISDFGLARIIGGKEIGANTMRVVGTYGYMSPEYALDGHFSIKSDVFSFGVILLEIISGKKNTGFYQSELALSLISYAWKLWTESKVLDLVDPALHEDCNAEQFVKCVNIGLLCVQENPGDRPTISNVVIMLESETATVPTPKQPAFVPRVDFSSTASSSSRLDTNTEISSIFGAR